MSWQIKSLDEVCTKITDGAHQSPKSVDHGKPMASVKDLTRFGVDLSAARRISLEDFERLVKQGCQPLVGDVLIAKDGNSALETVCNVKQPLNAVLLSSVAILRPNLNILDSDFLKYYLSSKEVIEYFKSNFISGAAIPRVVLRDFRKAQIRLPELKIQRKISKILSDLDEKIHLNNHINQTLESIAQTIFKSWFIDFDPVRAKIAAKLEGADPEIAAMCVISGKSEAELKKMPEDDFAELQATAVLFPDELVESELGGVPKGWEISKISKIGKVITGKTPSSKIENSFAEKGTFFITPTDIDTEVFVTNTNRYLSEYGEIAIKNSKVDEGSLCITCIGSQMGKVVITPKSAFTNQQINSILLFNSTLRNYIFLNLRQRRDEIFLIGSGGSTMPIINKSTFESLNLILPDLALIRKFDNFISPFFNNILSNSVENIELKNIRDALLPELLAGKINVSMLKDM